MNERIARLSVIRRVLGVVALLVIALHLYQMLEGLSGYRLTQVLYIALLGATFITWAIEEHFRGSQKFRFFLLVVGVFLMAVSAFVLINMSRHGL